MSDAKYPGEAKADAARGDARVREENVAAGSTLTYDEIMAMHRSADGKRPTGYPAPNPYYSTSNDTSIEELAEQVLGGDDFGDDDPPPALRDVKNALESRCDDIDSNLSALSEEVQEMKNIVDKNQDTLEKHTAILEDLKKYLVKLVKAMADKHGAKTSPATPPRKTYKLVISPGEFFPIST
ncbi:MAG: hypothetical protein KGL39_26650 [Patescibacteria group bacterium]|nr:hypothetical protein [Patescibacteria group bacterium]